MKKIMLGFLIATLLFASMSYAFAEDKSQTLVSKIYQNSLGDVLKVFDKNGQIQAKLGTANGTADNVGGTLALYNGDELKPFMTSGIRKDTLSGASVLYDKNGKIRLLVTGEQRDGEAGLLLYDDTGKCVTAIRQYSGYIDNKPIVTQDVLQQEIAKLQKQIDELKGAK